MTVKLLFLIYGRLDRRALKFGKPISSSACCQAFYSLLRKLHEHSIAKCLSIISSALVVRVVQRTTGSMYIDFDEYPPYNDYKKSSAESNITI